MPKFILFQGVPASGKSLIAYYSLHGELDAVYIGLDAIRLELTGSESDQSANAEVLAIAKSRAIRALEAGRNVILDSTLVKNEWANAWVELASTFGAGVGLVLVKVSLETALARNANRQRQVPEALIKQMYQDLQNFDYSGFDLQVIEND